MTIIQQIIDYGVTDYAVNVAIYLVLAFGAFGVFWVFYKEKFHSRRIQEKRSASATLLHSELKNSIIALLILTAVDVAIYYLQLKGYTKIYTEISEYGWAYLIFSVVLMILLHDAWFYFTHRFMHHPKIYKYVHKVHHQSTDPSPFASFSFHPFEAIINVGIFVVFAFAFPVHVVALWSWQLVHVFLNIIGHLGYEIYPAGLNKHWLFKFKAPSTHHNMHHEKFSGNYGFYFTWWDKIFKTEFADYNETYDRIHERVKNNSSLSKANVPSIRPIHSQNSYTLSRKAS